MDSKATRRPRFTDEANGLASLSSMEAGFSGHHHPHHPSPFISRPLYSAASQMRSGRFYDGKFERPHFLDSCFLCKKPLGDNKDIFMYRGDTPFCSEECRNEQMEGDEARDNKWNLSASMKALRKDQKKKSKSTSPNRAQQDYPFDTSSTVAAA